MQCSKCGSILNEGATFCPNCGAPVDSNVQTTNNDINNVPNNGVMSNPEVNQTPNTNQETVESTMQNPAEPTVQNPAEPNMNLNGNTEQPNPVPNAGPENQNDKKSSNKTAIIIVSIIAVLLVAALVYIFVFKDNGTVLNLDGINVYVPKDYTETSQDGYNNAYLSSEQDVIIGTISQSSYGATLDDYMNILDSVGFEESSNCEKGTKTTLKGTEWAEYNCGSDTVDAIMYITVKDDTMYGVSIEAKSSSSSKIPSLQKKVESNLEIVK